MLMEAAAFYRCALPQRLNGAGMKFIRKAIGMSAKDWAGDLSVDTATISRWESNNRPMSPRAEKHLRVTVFAYLLKDVIGVEIDARMIGKIDLSGFAQPMAFPDLSFRLVKVNSQEHYSETRKTA